jgi:phenylpyruvate tautomerase PptA (4-oxalocrotonate tautomerase family)
MPEESIIILIRENEPQNVSVGGRLIIDKNRK